MSASREGASWWGQLAWGIVIVVVTCVAMGGVVGHEFINWDDADNFAGNADYNPPKLASIWKYWAHGYMRLYVPLPRTVWAGIAAIAYSPKGMDAHWFHIASLSFHLITVLLVWGLLNWAVKNHAWQQRWGALIFAVHPLQVESVAWASGLKDVLAGMFSVLAILFFAGAARENVKRKWMWQCGAVVAVTLAALSKPNAVVVPVMAVVFSVYLLKQPWRRSVGILVVSLGIGVGISVVASVVQAANDAAILTPIYMRPMIALDALAFYMRQIVAPVHLCVDYGRSPDRVLASRAIHFTWIAPVAAGIVLLALRKRCPWAIVAAMMFLIPIAPLLGLVPFGYQVTSTVTDHYLYLPMVGVAIGAAFVLSGIRPAIAVPIGFAILAARGVRSWFQMQTWRKYADGFRT